MKTKKYFIDYEEFNKNKKSDDLAKEILNDDELATLDEIIIGDWLAYEYSIQPVLDMIVKNKEKFQHIKSFFIGDIEPEECEISWIEQGNYGEFLKSLPNLERLKIKGANNLSLGNINHNNLKTLEIICGGLGNNVIQQIAEANLPNLEKLNIYLGIEEYGFYGNIQDIKNLVNSLGKFKNLKYLGINNSDIQDKIVKVVLENNIIEQLEVLDFSNGTLTDKGGQLILNSIEKFKNLKFLNLHYHFLSNEMIKKLEKLPFKVDLDEQNEDDEEYGNYPMFTE